MLDIHCFYLDTVEMCFSPMTLWDTTFLAVIMKIGCLLGCDAIVVCRCELMF